MRPDIAYAVQQICLFMHDPREQHLSALKRILRAEAEYRGVANAVAETCWLRNLLRELHCPLFSATLVYCDNVSAVYMSGNPVQHQRTKHIEINIHFVRDLVTKGQVQGIETVTKYDTNAQEFIINTPCESAQKYWIGGVANHATHTVVFSQLEINGVNQGVHAFIAQIREENGKICQNVHIADCGHKIGSNGVDNGRIWFDNLRVPRENMLNSVADVSPDGQYLSAIKDPLQRFAAFMAPLTSGRVHIAAISMNIAKKGLATAVRYCLSKRTFSVKPNEREVLLLDYPSHQRRLLPLLAKT
ncbi:acyl-coenzyme A oxidase 3, peroxisomal-like [Rutidosis leptorrhynchoides]|uniref:acyl-coenzyme A oxidase 3, peroxisomal-like n=1 Tax=Rutidosis leptorrhynchoides TaxID=125765 RepID=UPI003A98EFFA